MRSPRSACWSSHRLLRLLLLSLLCLLPECLCQPLNFHSPDAVFRGWDILSFAVDAEQSMLYLVDGRKYLRAVNLTDGSLREDLVLSWPERQLQDITLLRRGSLLYVSLVSEWTSQPTGVVLAVSARDFTVVSNWTLASIIPSGTLPASPLMAGTDGLLYLATRNDITFAYAVWIIDGAGALVSNWSAPVPAMDYYSIAIDSSSSLYFHTSYSPSGTLYKLSRSGELQATLSLQSPYVDSIAVSPRGRIFLSAGWRATLYPFTADGTALTPWPLQTVAWGIEQLGFWSEETLLGLDRDSNSILVLSGGDTIGSVSPDTPLLRGYTSMDWDSSSSTLLISTFSSDGLGLQRVDPASGRVLQRFELPERLSSSAVWDISVDKDGNLWLLLSKGLRYQTAAVLVLSRAGRIRKELHLSNVGCTYYSLLVAVELNRMFLNCWDFRVESVLAFSLDGRSLFNISTGATDSYIYDMELGLSPPQLLVLESRIASGAQYSYDPLTGELLGNVTFPPGVFPLAIAVADDNGDVFLSQLSYALDGQSNDYNSSIVQISALGRPVAEYGSWGSGKQSVMTELVLTGDKRLFAVDSVTNALLMWRVEHAQHRSGEAVVNSRGRYNGSQLPTPRSGSWQPFKWSRRVLREQEKAELGE